MRVKYELVMRCDPDFGKVDVTTLKGFAKYNRDAMFWSLSLSATEAQTIFDRVEDFLQTQLGAHLGSQSNTKRS